MRAYLSRLKYAFEEDPSFQVAFNKFFTYFWIANFVAVPIVFVLARNFWDHYSVMYLVLASLYANIATNYSGLSASEASEYAQQGDAAASRILMASSTESGSVNENI